MPNFWSTATQKIYECFNGPRTKDIEFERKVDELKQCLQSIRTIRDTVFGFRDKTRGIQLLCYSIYTNLPKSYGDSQAYEEFLKDVCTSHHNVETAYKQCVENIENLKQLSNEWGSRYKETSKLIESRNKCREVYDHYDEKMEELVKEREAKFAKGGKETTSEIEKFDRNEDKYKRCAREYVQVSNNCYCQMQQLLDTRYIILNPLISNLVMEEKKFFDACSSFFSKFDNINIKIEALTKLQKPTQVSYDAAKYIRAFSLVGGNYVPATNQFNNTNNMNTNMNYNNNYSNNNPGQDKNKYSYEEYKKRKAAMKTPEPNTNNNMGYGNTNNNMGTTTQKATDVNDFLGGNQNNNFNNNANNYNYEDNPFNYNNNNNQISNNNNNNFGFGFDSQNNNNFNVANPYSDENLYQAENPYADINFDSNQNNNLGNNNNNNTNFGF